MTAPEHPATVLVAGVVACPTCDHAGEHQVQHDTGDALVLWCGACGASFVYGLDPRGSSAVTAPPIGSSSLLSARRVASVCEAAGLVRDGDGWRDEHVIVTAVTISCLPLTPDDDRDMVGIFVCDAAGRRQEAISEFASPRLLQAAIADVREWAGALPRVSAAAGEVQP